VTDPPDFPVGDLLERDHRRLDDLFGRFLAAAGAGEPGFAARAIGEFDAALRRHTELEEEHLYPESPGAKLVPTAEEGDRERLFRELRLEHVQIREVSGMMARLLIEKNDVAGARALAGNLARRWDAHTAREERDAFPLLADSLDPAGEAVLRNALAQSPGPPAK
jgi:thioredoxin-like negative regulator of GroEL